MTCIYRSKKLSIYKYLYPQWNIRKLPYSVAFNLGQYQIIFKR